jgi:hypothetical protein
MGQPDGVDCSLCVAVDFNGQFGALDLFLLGPYRTYTQRLTSIDLAGSGPDRS